MEKSQLCPKTRICVEVRLSEANSGPVRAGWKNLESGETIFVALRLRPAEVCGRRARGRSSFAGRGAVGGDVTVCASVSRVVAASVCAA